MLIQYGLILLMSSFINYSVSDYASPMQEDPCDFNVSFDFTTDSIWSLSQEDVNASSISLSLKMENQTDHALRFPLIDNYNLYVKYENGEIREMEGGLDNLTKVAPNSEPVLPGASYLLKFKGRLWKDVDKKVQLTIYDEFGNIWQLGPIQNETFWIGMSYFAEQRTAVNDQKFWCGAVEVPPKPIRIE